MGGAWAACDAGGGCVGDEDRACARGAAQDARRWGAAQDARKHDVSDFLALGSIS